MKFCNATYQTHSLSRREMSALPLKGKPQRDSFRLHFKKARDAFGHDKPYLYAKCIEKKMHAGLRYWG